MTEFAYSLLPGQIEPGHARVCTGRGTSLPAVRAARLRSCAARDSSSWSVKPSSSKPVEREEASVAAALQREDVSARRSARSAQCCTPLRPSRTTDVCLSCSVFARVIVALLVEAQAPELEHLWVFADDEPCADGKRRESQHRQQSKPDEENRYADENDRHPC